MTCALIKPAASGTLTDAAPKGTAPESTASERTALSCYDQTMARSAVGRALGYPGQRIEAAALEAALQATLADLPFLAGRCVPAHALCGCLLSLLLACTAVPQLPPLQAFILGMRSNCCLLLPAACCCCCCCCKNVLFRVPGARPGWEASNGSWAP